MCNPDGCGLGEGIDNKWLNQVVFKDSNTMLNIEPKSKVNTGR
jgi:hypothetical protein